MSRQCVEDDPGERHRPVRAVRLRWRNLRLLAGQDHELLPNHELAAEEVDLVQLDPDRLTLPQPGAGPEHDQRPCPNCDAAFALGRIRNSVEWTSAPAWKR